MVVWGISIPTTWGRRIARRLRRPEASDTQKLTQIAAEALLFLRWQNRQGLDAGDGLPGIALAVRAGVWCVCAEQDMVRPVEGVARQHATYRPLDRRVNVEHAVVV